MQDRVARAVDVVVDLARPHLEAVKGQDDPLAALKNREKTAEDFAQRLGLSAAKAVVQAATRLNRKPSVVLDQAHQVALSVAGQAQAYGQPGYFASAWLSQCLSRRDHVGTAAALIVQTAHRAPDDLLTGARVIRFPGRR